MRLFNALIFDECFGPSDSPRASQAWGMLLARADSLKFTFVVDTVVGNPTLTFNLMGGLGFDDTAFCTETTKVILNQALTAGSGTKIYVGTYSPSDAKNPPPRYLTVEGALSGTTESAHVRVWACGRGPQLLETMPTTQTFGTLLRAAQTLADENRRLGQQRFNKAGTSAFFPPEVFLPTLHWDR